MNRKKRNKTSHKRSQASAFSHKPFAALDGMIFPKASHDSAQSRSHLSPKKILPKKHRGRVDIIRQRAHRGGKTVTLVTNFVGVDHQEKEALLRKMQGECGAGGTLKEGNIEIQGEQRVKVATILKEAGFRPVFAGG